jgi:hypothetical protein
MGGADKAGDIQTYAKNNAPLLASVPFWRKTLNVHGVQPKASLSMPALPEVIAWDFIIRHDWLFCPSFASRLTPD